MNDIIKIIKYISSNKENIMSKRLDLTGQKFGKLEVLGFSGIKNGRSMWECICSCGNHKNIQGTTLKSGVSKSCGCSWFLCEDLTGMKFNRLTVKNFSHRKGNKFFYDCLCICGSICKVRSDNLKDSTTKSCGCLVKENNKDGLNNKIHGESSNGVVSKEYRCWQSIKDRCYNSNLKEFKYWGGRGITVCDRWLESFEYFLEDMGRAPIQDKSCSLDRYPNKDGNYEPENCRWSNPQQQSNNRNEKGYLNDYFKRPI